MEALFDAAKASVHEIGMRSRDTSVYKEECLKLGRYVSKVALILAELELQLQADEDLRGSKNLFVAIEAVLGALQQATNLANQCSSTGSGRIWPMEDAVEFQSVALELLNAMEKVAKAQLHLPEDLAQDVDHFLNQLKTLKFTQAELEESEEVELKQLQIENKKKAEAAAEGASLVDVQTPPAKGGTPPSDAISNIKPFRSAAAASAAAVKDLDDTWEEVENEQVEKDIEENQQQKDEEGCMEEGEGVTAVIPPPDEKLLEILDEQGVVYVNPDNPSETALPPGAAVKGAVGIDKNEAELLPSDPFRMQEGAQAQVKVDANLPEKMFQELQEMKKTPVDS